MLLLIIPMLVILCLFPLTFISLVTLGSVLESTRKPGQPEVRPIFHKALWVLLFLGTVLPLIVIGLEKVGIF